MLCGVCKLAMCPQFQNFASPVYRTFTLFKNKLFYTYLDRSYFPLL